MVGEVRTFTKYVFEFTLLLNFQYAFSQDCIDLMGESKCTTYKVKKLCFSLAALQNCQKTCGFCGTGWEKWSQWGDCSATLCEANGEQVRTRRCKSSLKYIDCPGSDIESQNCARSKCRGSNSECKFGEFKCIAGNESISEQCLPNSLICDGYPDCLGENDELDCELAGGPDDAFLISSKSSPKYCMKYDGNGEIKLIWDCPDKKHPNSPAFLWKWNHHNSLRNILSGRCLQATSDSVVGRLCNNKNKMQFWNCTSNGAIQIFSNSTEKRFLNVDVKHLRLLISDNSSLFWKVHGTDDTVCSKRTEWSAWGDWTSCEPTCVDLGKGLKSRSRSCINGVIGHGACIGNQSEFNSCEHHICKPKCPYNFTNSGFPWACFKLVTDKKLNLMDAKQACSDMSVQGVKLRATLAADKTLASHHILLSLLDSNHISDAYIGSDIQINNGKIIMLNYSIDAQPVGDLEYNHLWHEITLTEISQGWMNDSNTKFRIQTQGGECLNLNKMNKAYLSSCSSPYAFWRIVNGILINAGSKTCLSWNYTSDMDTIGPNNTIINGTNTTVLDQPKIGGVECFIRDKTIKWRLHEKYIQPDGISLLLGSDGENLTLNNWDNYKWIGYSMLGGLNRLSTIRDWTGHWCRYRSDGYCLAPNKFNEVTMEPCISNDTYQRWSIISPMNLLHRDSGLCLSIKRGEAVRNDSTLSMEACSKTDELQFWTIRSGGESGKYEILSYKKNGLTIQPFCGILAKGGIRICISELGSKMWEKETEVEDHMAEKMTLVGVSRQQIGEQKHCMVPLDVKCNGTELVYSECNEQHNGWWMWQEGRMLINVPSSDYFSFNCCLSVINAEAGETLALQECDDENQMQIWSVLEEERGSLLSLTSKPSLVVFRKESENNSDIKNYTKESSLRLADNGMIQWNVVSEDGTVMKLPVIYSCQGKGNIDDVTYQHTQSGKLCQAWNSQFPHEHSYRLEAHNFCSNPPSYRLDSHPLWCLTTNPEVRWEVCNVPLCALDLGIVFSATSRTWKITGGKELLPYICEAPVECVYGNGLTYKGTVSHSDSGKQCLNWKKRQEKLQQESSGIFVPDHPFCRNPNNDPKGVWCWVETHTMEYCSFIQQCKLRCVVPPIPFRGRILKSSFSQAGPNYANGSQIVFGCEQGYHIISTIANDENGYNLICMNGKWRGVVPACNIITCEVPANGVRNAQIESVKKEVIINSSFSYRCLDGHLFSDGWKMISLTCGVGNKWMADHLPIEYYYMDMKSLTNTDIGQLTCYLPCDQGFDAVSSWCFKILRSATGLPFHSSSLSCPNGAQLPPPDVLFYPNTYIHLDHAITEQILVATHEITSADILKMHTFRSKMTGLPVNSSSTVDATFYIQTWKQFDLKVDDPDSDMNRTYLCVTTSEGATNSTYPLLLQKCPNNQDSGISFKFRWITPRHIYHPATRSCFESVSTLGGDGIMDVYLSACNFTKKYQFWLCDQSLILNFDSRFLFIKSKDNANILSITEDYGLATKFVAVGNISANQGKYKNDSICQPIFQPRDEIFHTPCNKQLDSIGSLRKGCSSNQNITDACDLQQGFPAKLSTFINMKYPSCRCGWVDSNEPKIPNPHSACANLGHECPASEVERAVMWCQTKRTPKEHNVVDSGNFCLGLRKNERFSQVTQIPCDAPVSETVCTMKARFSCTYPDDVIENGYRVLKNEGLDGEKLDIGKHLSFVYDTSVSYMCMPGFRFPNGDIRREIRCQHNRTWSMSPKLNFCVPIYCRRPFDQVHAHSITIPKNTVQVEAGTKVQVRCKAGYVISTAIRSMFSTCDLDGIWRPPLLLCKPISCGIPPYVRHTIVIGSSFSLHSSIVYKCNYGMNFVKSDGKLVNESFHRCRENGHWFPLPNSLNCVEITCPNITNVVRSRGKNLGKIVTIGCRNGDSIYYNGQYLNQPQVDAVCSSNGIWKPPVHELSCRPSECVSPNVIENANILPWDPLDRKASKPYPGSRIMLECARKHQSHPHFMIFNMALAHQVCIGVNATDHHRSLRIYDYEYCISNVTTDLLWRWWKNDNQHIQHVATSLCMTSSLPSFETKLKGSHDVILQTCRITDRRQKWECSTGEVIPFYVTLLNQGNQTLLLKYNIQHESIVVSNVQDGIKTQWSTQWGSDICSQQEPTKEIELTCSKTGGWIPALEEVECWKSECTIPSEGGGIIFHTQHINDGKKFNYGERILANCADGYWDSAGGSSPSIQLHCGGTGQWSPSIKNIQCVPIICKPVKNILHTVITPGTRRWSYMSEVKLSCIKGMWFERIKTRSQIISCGRDRLWSQPPALLSCTPVRCPKSYAIPKHAELISNINDFSFKDTFIIKCDSGRWIKRNQPYLVVTCGEDGFWIPRSAECVRVSCLAVPIFSIFTKANINKLGYLPVGKKINLECYKHHRNETKSIVVRCGLNGNWRPDPRSLSCQFAGCEKIENLRKVLKHAIVTGKDLTLASVIEVNCETGFIMNDGSTMKKSTCLSDAKWYPSLHALQCKPVSCNRPTDVRFGIMDTFGSTMYRGIAELTCQENRIVSLNKARSIILQCSSLGNWVPDISKLSCLPSTCTKPRTSPYKIITIEESRVGTVVATLNCIEGYWFEPGISELKLTCDENGFWQADPDNLNCYPVVCPDIPLLSNIRMNPLDIRESSQTTTTVVPSFDEMHSNQSQLKVVQDQSDVSQMRNIKYGMEIEHICEDGYWISPGVQKQRSLCQANGTYDIPFWILKPCVPVTCTNAFTIQNAKVIQVKKGPLGYFTVGTQLTYQCITGKWFKTLQRTSLDINCTSSGTWEPDPKKYQCVGLECPALPSYILNHTDVRNFGAELNVHCAYGYALSKHTHDGNLTLKCDRDAKWYPRYKAGVCVPVSCNNPSKILHSEWKLLGGTSYTDKAVYTCESEWSVKRNTKSWEVMCTGMGVWEPSDEQCVQDDLFQCDTPMHKENTKRLLPLQYVKDAVVLYTCKTDYRMSGNRKTQSSVCQSNGNWIPDIQATVNCQPVTCENPDTPSNAERDFIGNSENLQPYYKTGQSIVFQCKETYWVENRTIQFETFCQSNNTWYPDLHTMKCVPYDCPALPRIENATYTTFVNSHNLPEVKYSCNSGLLLIPSLTSKTQYFTSSCYMKKWIPTPDQRKCRVLRCPVPPSIPYSHRVLGSRLYNCTTSYYCYSGYRWSHNALTEVTIRCNEAEEWEPNIKRFSCVVLSCGTPLSMEGAIAQYNGTEYLQEVRFQCSHGTKIYGRGTNSIRAICMEDGLWHPSPGNAVRCVEIACPSPPSFKHAVPMEGYSYKIGSSWLYSCKKGFHVHKGISKFNISCSEFETWESLVEDCVPIQCGRPPHIPQSSVTVYNHAVLKSGEIKEFAYYTCDTGRWISRGTYKSLTSVVHCFNGAWIPDPMHAVKCVWVTCNMLLDPTPEMGIHNFSRTHHQNNPKFNAVAVYHCPIGQFFRKLNKRVLETVCEADGRWSFNMHDMRCEPTFCPLNIEDPNAVWSQPYKTSFGSSLQVNCKPGFWFDVGVRSLTLECGENGTWVPEVLCLHVSCQEPIVKHGTFQFQGVETNQFPVASKLNFQCDEGHETWYGDDVILVCQAIGQWNPQPSILTCSPIKCRKPETRPDSQNGNYQGGNSFNSSMRFQCNKGFMISPGRTYETAQCMANKLWSQDLSVFKCIPIHCIHNGTIENGKLITDSGALLFKYKKIVLVSCLQGFWIERQKRQISALCGDDAKWEPSLDDIFCKPISCIPMQSRISSVMHPYNLTVGSNAIMECGPVSWISHLSKGSWTLSQYVSEVFRCTERGEWDKDYNTIKCMSTLLFLWEENEMVHDTSKTGKQVRFSPDGEYKWLNNLIQYEISGPGDGSEVSQLLETLSNDKRKFIMDDSLQRVFTEHQSYSQLYEKLLFEPSTSQILNNCSRNFTMSEIQSLFRDDQAVHGKDILRELSLQCNNITLSDKELHADPSSIAREILVVRSRIALNNKVLIERMKNETILALKKPGRRQAKLDAPIIVSSKEGWVWDGDPLTAWKPNDHALLWKFEIHLGECYILKKIMIMSQSDVVMNVSVSTADNSSARESYGPFDMKNKKAPQSFSIDSFESAYGSIITISGFTQYPSSLVEFSFDFPPVIREIGFYAAIAKQEEIALFDAYTVTLILLIFSFILILTLACSADKHRRKSVTITWFGERKDRIPIILQFTTKRRPSSSMNIYIQVLPKSQFIVPSHIAWLRARSYTNFLRGSDRIGMYVGPFESSEITCRIAFEIVREGKLEENYGEELWIIQDVHLFCKTKKWVCQESQLHVTPDECLSISFQPTEITHNKLVDSCIQFLKIHMLAFIFAPLERSHQIFQLSSRIVSVFAATVVSMMIAVIIHESFDMNLPEQTLDILISGFVNISSKSAVCILSGIFCGVFLLSLLRALSSSVKVKSSVVNMSWPSDAVLQIPGLALYNLLMAYNEKTANCTPESGNGDIVNTIGYSYPSNSTMMLWMKQRKHNQFDPFPDIGKNGSTSLHNSKFVPNPSAGFPCIRRYVKSDENVECTDSISLNEYSIILGKSSPPNSISTCTVTTNSMRVGAVENEKYAVVSNLPTDHRIYLNGTQNRIMMFEKDACKLNSEGGELNQARNKTDTMYVNDDDSLEEYTFSNMLILRGDMDIETASATQNMQGVGIDKKTGEEYPLNSLKINVGGNLVSDQTFNSSTISVQNSNCPNTHTQIEITESCAKLPHQRIEQPYIKRTIVTASSSLDFSTESTSLSASSLLTGEDISSSTWRFASKNLAMPTIQSKQERGAEQLKKSDEVSALSLLTEEESNHMLTSKYDTQSTTSKDYSLSTWRFATKNPRTIPTIQSKQERGAEQLKKSDEVSALSLLAAEESNHMLSSEYDKQSTISKDNSLSTGRFASKNTRTFPTIQSKQEKSAKQLKKSTQASTSSLLAAEESNHMLSSEYDTQSTISKDNSLSTRRFASKNPRTIATIQSKQEKSAQQLKKSADASASSLQAEEESQHMLSSKYDTHSTTCKNNSLSIQTFASTNARTMPTIQPKQEENAKQLKKSAEVSALGLLMEEESNPMLSSKYDTQSTISKDNSLSSQKFASENSSAMPTIQSRQDIVDKTLKLYHEDLDSSAATIDDTTHIISYSDIGGDLKHGINDAEYHCCHTAFNEPNQKRIAEINQQPTPGINENSSKFSIASGLRTIYSHVEMVPDRTQLFEAPGFCTLFVIIVLSVLALTICSYLVYTADKDIQYVRDTAISSCTLLIFLGTFIEAGLSSLFIACGWITEEIDFTNQATCEKLKAMDSSTKTNCREDCHLGLSSQTKHQFGEGDADNLVHVNLDSKQEQHMESRVDTDTIHENLLSTVNQLVNVHLSCSCPGNMKFKFHKQNVALQVQSDSDDNTSKKVFFEQIQWFPCNFSFPNLENVDNTPIGGHDLINDVERNSISPLMLTSGGNIDHEKSRYSEHSENHKTKEIHCIVSDNFSISNAVKMRSTSDLIIQRNEVVAETEFGSEMKEKGSEFLWSESASVPIPEIITDYYDNEFDMVSCDETKSSTLLSIKTEETPKTCESGNEIFWDALDAGYSSNNGTLSHSDISFVSNDNDKIHTALGFGSSCLPHEGSLSKQVNAQYSPSVKYNEQFKSSRSTEYVLSKDVPVWVSQANNTPSISDLNLGVEFEINMDNIVSLILEKPADNYGISGEGQTHRCSPSSWLLSSSDLDSANLTNILYDEAAHSSKSVLSLCHDHDELQLEFNGTNSESIYDQDQVSNNGAKHTSNCFLSSYQESENKFQTTQKISEPLNSCSTLFATYSKSSAVQHTPESDIYEERTKSIVAENLRKKEQQVSTNIDSELFVQTTDYEQNINEIKSSHSEDSEYHSHPQYEEMYSNENQLSGNASSIEPGDENQAEPLKSVHSMEDISPDILRHAKTQFSVIANSLIVNDENRFESKEVSDNASTKSNRTDINIDNENYSTSGIISRFSSLGSNDIAKELHLLPSIYGKEFTLQIPHFTMPTDKENVIPLNDRMQEIKPKILQSYLSSHTSSTLTNESIEPSSSLNAKQLQYIVVQDEEKELNIEQNKKEELCLKPHEIMPKSVSTESKCMLQNEPKGRVLLCRVNSMNNEAMNSDAIESTRVIRCQLFSKQSGIMQNMVQDNEPSDLPGTCFTKTRKGLHNESMPFDLEYNYFPSPSKIWMRDRKNLLSRSSSDDSFFSCADTSNIGKFWQPADKYQSDSCILHLGKECSTASTGYDVEKFELECPDWCGDILQNPEEIRYFDKKSVQPLHPKDLEESSKDTNHDTSMTTGNSNTEYFSGGTSVSTFADLKSIKNMLLELRSGMKEYDRANTSSTPCDTLGLGDVDSQPEERASRLKQRLKYTKQVADFLDKRKKK